jgi:sugar phosphate isomerase/epimerase
MDYGLSTYLFVKERLSPHILDHILATGLSHLEIFAARQHLDYHEKNQVDDLAQWFRDHDLKLFSVHAPLYSDFDWGRSGGQALAITYLERRKRIESMEEIKRALEIAERLPFRYLVLHMGLENDEYELAKFDAALTCLEHLKIFAKERGVQILLENIPNEVSTPERLVDFIEYTRLHEVKFCFDVGHAHMVGDVQSAFSVLKDRVVSTHVHDNHREKDEHLLPFEGGINWEQTIRDFRSAGGQFPLLFELGSHGPELTTLARLREVMERLEAIS